MHYTIDRFVCMANRVTDRQPIYYENRNAVCKFARGTSERRLCVVKKREREEKRKKLAMEEALYAIKWIVNIAGVAVCECYSCGKKQFFERIK